MAKQPILLANNISKTFGDPVSSLVLREISLKIEPGEFVSITGKSGCGKSTLLYILSTMDTSYQGDLWIDGELMRGQDDSKLALVRNKRIGFVFQFHYLLNEFSVVENVMLPGLKLGNRTEDVVYEEALQNLDLLGIGKLKDKKANQISGGEKQRVAIARALINKPEIIICDEPTGNLDKVNSQIVLETFLDLNRKFQQTLLVVTHDLEFADRTQRIIKMEDGKIVQE
jgi:lipoprotein-releasing system ATP-binding protein